MFRKTISAISVLSFLSLGSVGVINAADQPAVWLQVTADGVPGTAPSPNTIKAKGQQNLISKNKCKNNKGKGLGAIAGGILGSSRGGNLKDKILGGAAGAGIGAAAGAAMDGC